MRRAVLGEGPCWGKDRVLGGRPLLKSSRAVYVVCVVLSPCLDPCRAILSCPYCRFVGSYLNEKSNVPLYSLPFIPNPTSIVAAIDPIVRTKYLAGRRRERGGDT